MFARSNKINESTLSSEHGDCDTASERALTEYTIECNPSVWRIRLGSNTLVYVIQASDGVRWYPFRYRCKNRILGHVNQCDIICFSHYCGIRNLKWAGWFRKTTG